VSAIHPKADIRVISSSMTAYDCGLKEVIPSGQYQQTQPVWTAPDLYHAFGIIETSAGRPKVSSEIKGEIMKLRQQGMGIIRIGKTLGVGTNTVQRVIG